MAIRATDIDNIRKLLELAELRATHVEAIRKLDKEITALTRVSRRSLRRHRSLSPAKSKPGALAHAIIQLLTSAGPEGMSVAEIATALKKPVQNIRVWFSTTGKKNSRIKKLAAGRFALKKRR